MNWFACRGIETVRDEVRTHGVSRADVVGLTDDSHVVAVELKVRDWRRALQQAILNRYCAHESYIAVWWDAISQLCEERCAAHGVGLISVEERGYQLVVEAKHVTPDAQLAEAVRARIRG